MKAESLRRYTLIPMASEYVGDIAESCCLAIAADRPTRGSK